MNVCAICHSNPSYNWVILVWPIDHHCHPWSHTARKAEKPTIKLNVEKEQEDVSQQGPSCCENSVRYKLRYKQIPCFCLINISVDHLPPLLWWYQRSHSHSAEVPKILRVYEFLLSLWVTCEEAGQRWGFHASTGHVSWRRQLCLDCLTDPCLCSLYGTLPGNT